MEYEGRFYDILNNDVDLEMARRHESKIASEILHDLISSSLGMRIVIEFFRNNPLNASSVPLTERPGTPDEFTRRAVEFVSCFTSRSGMSVRSSEE